ncbi:putative phage tail protein [Megamonas funiformis]|uniref:putative phage tail protein n=1 Tax=Megamonas funiformis TaxID=437897 RepID=UPI0029426955|nr:putative phage tail protein [Megamonas funiformis]
MDNLEREVKVQRYYPNVIANADEFKQLAILENEEFKSIWEVLFKWFKNRFVSEADLEGVRRWEQMLKIIPSKEATLEDRKQFILRRINTILPYTIRRLQQILNAVYGDDFAVVSTNKKYELWVDIDNRIILKTPSMRTLLRAIIPANLIIKILQELNADLFLYAGGIVSNVNTIQITMGKEFTINELYTKMIIVGNVSTLTIISLKTKNI